MTILGHFSCYSFICLSDILCLKVVSWENDDSVIGTA